MKNFSKLQFLLIFSLVLGFNAETKAELQCYPSSVYLVRHAEKMLTPGERDPELTLEGHKRAKTLADQLKDIKLNTIYSSQFKRTQQTVLPTAKNQSLELEIRDASSIQILAEDVLDACDENILIAGHSNTVPLLLKALGLEITVNVQGKKMRFEPVVYLNDKKDYGTLFKVTFKQNGSRVLDLTVF